MGLLTMSELSGLGDLREDGSRCLPCHFEEEECHAIRLLPPRIQRRLLLEHAAIERSFKAGRVPHALLEAHADLEDKIFPLFLPGPLAQSLMNDHASYRKKTPHWGCEN